MDTPTKTGIDAAKTASKRVVQKTAEATGDLIGNKIADEITSIGKPKKKGKKQKKQKKLTFHQKKDNKLLMTCFEHKMWHDCIRMEFPKIANFLDTTCDDKKWIEVFDQSGKNCNPNKEV